MSDNFPMIFDGRHEVSLLLGGRDVAKSHFYVAAGYEFGYLLKVYRGAGTSTFRIKMIRDDDPRARARASEAFHRFHTWGRWEPFPPGPQGYDVSPERAGKALVAVYWGEQWSPVAQKISCRVVGSVFLGAAFFAISFGSLFLLVGAACAALSVLSFWWSFRVARYTERQVAEEREVLRRYEMQRGAQGL